MGGPAEDNTSELDPALDGMDELGSEPSNPGHPLQAISDLKNRVTPIDQPRARARSKPRRVQPESKPARETKRERRNAPQSFRSRWPKGLDVRHEKKAIEELQRAFEPLSENRLKTYGRFGCEPLSHVDLARAFVDFCRGRIKLPKNGCPKDYDELRKLVEDGMEKWAAGKHSAPKTVTLPGDIEDESS
jgi:hypothetical protein